MVEIQALVTASVFGNAQRTATGLDRNRVSLIMAVLEKRAGLMLQNQDAYLKAAGGVKLDEPAIDLAIAVSIASSYKTGVPVQLSVMSVNLGLPVRFVGSPGLNNGLPRHRNWALNACWCQPTIFRDGTHQKVSMWWEFQPFHKH